jgi:hypothetical protein
MLHRPVHLHLAFALCWCALPVLGHEMPPVEVVAHRDDAPGSSDAASQGTLGAQRLQARVLAVPGQLLEAIPGLVVTQHSGEGKANQYFLRGMNLDHGSDFATTVNGVPLNLPTHAHGQGYSDFNGVIPELVSRIDHRKGPYAAAEGDFATAGAASVVYRTRLERPMAEFTLGPHGYQRSLLAGSTEVGEGATLLMALERLNHDGPWTVPQGLRKSLAQLILSGGSAREGWSLSLMDHAAHWRATDQVPQRLLDAGSHQGQPFGRFDSLDASDGAQTRRTSLSGSWQQAGDAGKARLEWYLLRYSLDLFSNFTYSLQRPSDQFGQSDERTVWGAKASRSWLSQTEEGVSLQHTVGLQLRQDHIRLGLYDTVARQITATVREDAVRQTAVGVFGESAIGWNDWLRTVAGLRLDLVQMRVGSALQPLNSADVGAATVSPRFSLILGPWQSTELFLHAGRGFHSNDARGATSRIDPRSGQPLEPVPVLAASRGHEIGLKSQLGPRLQTALALWQLEFDSELVYAGDTGSTQAGRASRRTGLEWSGRWTPGQHLALDASMAWTRPRYTDGDAASRAIPNAVQKVAQIHLAWQPPGPWSGALGVRYIGSAPLTEDNSVRSASSLTLNARVQRRVNADLDLALSVLNLTDRPNQDIAYAYVSRLPGEAAAGVPDVHLHPAEPRSVRLTARLRF